MSLGKKLFGCLSLREANILFFNLKALFSELFNFYLFSDKWMEMFKK